MSVKLSDVKLAQEDESQTLGSGPIMPSQDYMTMPPVAVDQPVEPSREFVVFKMVKKRNGKVYVDGIDDVINPETKKQERMRLLSGHPSVWIKDQKEVSDQDARTNRRSLEFISGICRIPVWDEQALFFARNSRHFIHNKNRKSGSKFEFFEYDPKAQAEAALEKELFEMRMVAQAATEKEENMLEHAAYLGIQPLDEYGFIKPPSKIREEYMLVAKRSPDRFAKTAGSKEVKIFNMVKKAIENSRIDIGKVQGMAYWADGGAICRIPAGRKPFEYLVELAQTNSADGIAFLKHLSN